MGFFGDLFKAFKGYSKTLSFITDHKLWSYFLIPAVINITIFIGIGFAAYYYSGELIDFLTKQLGLEALNETMGLILQFFMALLIRFTVFIIYLKLYKYLVLILLSPVLALMAEKIYKLSGAQQGSINTMTFLRNIFRGIKVATINMITEIGLIILIVITTLFIPVISPFSPFMIFAIESYFYGFSMIDYRHELLNLSYRESKESIWSRKGLAVGNGAVFNLFLLVPVIGVLTAPLISLTAAHLAMQENYPKT
ncbi:MAG: EI24 domain-containing protein [Bacteroidetes bacterium]|nr:EI24 domain-containing protein [Bacteroidota bacterium]MDA1121328.1 EI24 domain-containing protein [Bacteroidota bacterium]